MLTISHHDPDYWAEHTCRAMGTTVHIVVGDCAKDLLRWASDELERLEQSWSRFRPESELSLVNASSGSRVAVSDVMWSALERCDRLWHETQGAFDPTVIDALERWGYDQSFELVSRDGAALEDAGVAGRQRWDAVLLDPDSRAVRLRNGVRIDLGGIGKGLAADRLAEGLVDRGAHSACVSLGGDIRVAGNAPDDGWALPLEDPSRPGSTRGTCAVRRGALAMSTTLIRRWRRGAIDAHHIIDPSSQGPSRSGLVAAVVAADEAWWAEGLAKAAIIRGPLSGAALLQHAGVSGWLTTTDGDTARVESEGGPRTCSRR